MELPKEEGAYLFYFGNNEQFYDIDEVLLDDEGNPYLLAHYATGTPTHWWHLPEPNEHFKTDYEVGRNVGIQEGIERVQKAHQIRPRGKSMLAHLPEGYVLVPVEPTEKMIEAGYNAYVNSGWIRTYEIYEAMIQAAQEEE